MAKKSWGSGGKAKVKSRGSGLNLGKKSGSKAKVLSKVPPGIHVAVEKDVMDEEADKEEDFGFGRRANVGHRVGCTRRGGAARDGPLGDLGGAPMSAITSGAGGGAGQHVMVHWVVRGHPITPNLLVISSWILEHALLRRTSGGVRAMSTHSGRGRFVMRRQWARYEHGDDRTDGPDGGRAHAAT
ncbi:hypothetical protein C8F04DRAFT_1180366 [Mycena alexandri]|uniref:Uncharacterized protein n=1 Tax=Mycena alexandri TaxID=1745969 RepID=A0AAD6X3I0_9AGAR|nr:hypothetical protein C8F04DRAFT_1180366 [Mycena alexandri]